MVRLDAKQVRSLRIDLADRGETYCPGGRGRQIVLDAPSADAR